jgi:hypothetical protein
LQLLCLLLLLPCFLLHVVGCAIAYMHCNNARLHKLLQLVLLLAEQHQQRQLLLLPVLLLVVVLLLKWRCHVLQLLVQQHQQRQLLLPHLLLHRLRWLQGL